MVRLVYAPLLGEEVDFEVYDEGYPLEHYYYLMRTHVGGAFPPKGEIGYLVDGALCEPPQFEREISSHTREIRLLARGIAREKRFPRAA